MSYCQKKNFVSAAAVALTDLSPASSSAAAGDIHRPNPKKKSRRIRPAERAALLLTSACATLPRLKQIHAHILRSNLHHHTSLSSLLFSHYASSSSSSLKSAIFAFSLSPRPDLLLFNLAIRTLSKHSAHAPDALRLYCRMTRLAVSPDRFTFPFLLNSAAALPSLPSGAELHSRLLRSGLRDSLPTANALVDMYGKCGGLASARQAFDEMPVRDVVSYNAILGAHARVGDGMESAKGLFDGMCERNVISYNAMVVGYVNAGDLGAARAVFDAMPVRNVVSWTVMVIGYGKCGMMDMARQLFDGMPNRNLVLWTVMITGYAHSGQPDEALAMFHGMERDGIEPDGAAMVGVISACAQLGSIELVNWVASYVETKHIERNDRVLTALVDMHAKCGNVDEACRLFEEIHPKDAFSYAALINGIASHDCLRALRVFDQMIAEALKPDHITFVGVLSACSHAGFVEEGLELWESMARDYGIERGPDHYACIVDMLGRAGRLAEAHEMVKKMPKGPHAGALGALLAACRTYDNVEIAESVASDLFELEPHNTGNYVLLSSIYASREQWADAERVRKAMKQWRMNKLTASSWVEDIQGTK